MKTSAGDEVYDRGRLSVTLSMLPTADAIVRSMQKSTADRVGAREHCLSPEWALELLPYKKLALVCSTYIRRVSATKTTPTFEK